MPFRNYFSKASKHLAVSQLMSFCIDTELIDTDRFLITLTLPRHRNFAMRIWLL